MKEVELFVTRRDGEGPNVSSDPTSPAAEHHPAKWAKEKANLRLTLLGGKEVSGRLLRIGPGIVEREVLLATPRGEVRVPISSIVSYQVES